jgi:hypothetical protein
MLAMMRTGRRHVLATVGAMTVLAVAAAGCAASATAGGGTQAAVTTRAASTAARSASAAVSLAPLALPSVSASPSPSPSPWPLVVPVPAAQAGQHQTGTLPSAQDAMFQAEMTDLWAGIVSGRPDLAMSAFFPLVAYQQVKAIAYPAADWEGRLVPEFKADVIAAHGLIGATARQATFVRVIVPEQQADWISPGVCANGVGYWHVAGARLVYRVGGEVMSFGIATLISWRGEWYVVHLGGELRTSYGGMVDQPAAGPGVPGPAGGC